MWVSSVAGTFSVVQAGAEPGKRPSAARKLMVRARVRKHLELLQRDHPSLRRFPIIRSEPGRDYAFRIIVPRTTFARVMAAMVEKLTYSNFKSAAAAAPDLEPDYIDALHSVWSVFRKLQK
jgi:hypothetical protein